MPNHSHAMNDKDYREQKARVKKFWDKWHDAIGLNWWQIDLIWNRERNEDTPSEVGNTASNWQYRTASVTFNLPEIATRDDERVEGYVVHEMVHILIAAIQDFRDDQAREITEYTTETVARALLWARKAGAKDKVS